MAKIIRLGKTVVALFDNGRFLESGNVSDGQFRKMVSAVHREKELAALIGASLKGSDEGYESYMTIAENIWSSKLLENRGDSVYWPDVSGLSMPQSLAGRVLESEKAGDTEKIEAYKNFWTLASINPDERCRRNLFWFLEKYGMRIAKCGFFVGYRNAQSTAEDGVYTDYYTQTFRIRIGEMVTMPRDKCDTNQDVVCGRGLHVAGMKWLERNYFGDKGMAVLVNPADVVAVPTGDSYGKLRTCAYLPIRLVEYDNDGHIIPLDVEDGFDCSYVAKVIYEGVMGTESDSPYKIKIPESPETDKESIQNRLFDIALKCITDRREC